MQTNIFDIADEATVTPKPDFYECDDCGFVFSPEDTATFTAMDLCVYECETCEEAYVKDAARKDSRRCPECGDWAGVQVTHKSSDGCPICINGELQPKHLPEL